MPHWLLKAVVQNCLSRLPGGRRVNALLQRFLTGSTVLDDVAFKTRLHQIRKHLNDARRFGWERPESVVELGTGCYPILPVGFSLTGVGRVYTLDIVNLLQPRTVRATLLMFVEYLECGGLESILGNAITIRSHKLKTALESLDCEGANTDLEGLNVYHLVGPAYATGLEPESVDFFVSNNTLEHISAAELKRIFVEFRRLARPGALMSHSVDLQDHYAMFDRRLTPFHFYRYTLENWRRFNSSLHYVNRLRPSDYRRLIETSGWRVVECQIRYGDPSHLRRTQLAPEFSRYHRRDLLAVSCHLFAIPE